jgi:hypothetical protein
METFSPDFRDLLSEFNDHGVEYLVVGAHALAAHGHVRATKDLDVWVRPSLENGPRVLGALRAFGAPCTNLAVEDLASPGLIFQIGVAPVRIDVITQVDGLTFEDAWRDRITTRFAGVPTAVLSRRALILNKTAAGRPQDLADIAWLNAHPETS